MRGLRPDWAHMLLQSVERDWGAFDVHSLARLLHGLAALRCAPAPDFMAVLASRLAEALVGAQDPPTTQDLANVVWALARLRAPAPLPLVGGRVRVCVCAHACVRACMRACVCVVCVCACART